MWQCSKSFAAFRDGSCSTLAVIEYYSEMHMRLMTGAIAVVMVGCAGAPTQPNPAPATVASQPAVANSTGAVQASTTAATSATTATNAAGAGGAPSTDAQRVSHAKKLGLTVMTVKGEVLYCRTERKTGSHVATETNCLTQDQLDDLHEQTSRDLDYFRRPALPKPSG
jgi:hypothetical protein